LENPAVVDCCSVALCCDGEEVNEEEGAGTHAEMLTVGPRVEYSVLESKLKLQQKWAILKWAA